MNSNENINVGDIKTQSLKDRFNGFIKQKLMIIILTLGCLIFVLKDAIKYEKSSEELIVLGLDFIITYAFTLYITTIMGKMGLKAGINSINYIQTMAYYSRAKEETESIRSFLPRYCEIKNEEEIKSIQREILYQENLFIDKLNEIGVKHLHCMAVVFPSLWMLYRCVVRTLKYTYSITYRARTC